MERKETITSLLELLDLIKQEINKSAPLKIIWSNPISKEFLPKQELYTNEPESKQAYAHHYIKENQSFTTQISTIQSYELTKSLSSQYKQILVKTQHTEYQCLQNKKGKVRILNKAISNNTLVQREAKQYLIGPETPFLKDLGLATTNHKIKAEAQKKYRQINKFVEIIDATIRDEDRVKPIKVFDFGCGKGYLTFGLYHYLKIKKSQDLTVTGIDLKRKVIHDCNSIAKKLDYTSLKFDVGDITNSAIKSCDMLIALHACDIATDIALHKAIVSRAKYIFSSPCCHKEVRKLMKKSTSPMLKHGILLERQAEMATDVLRTLLLEQQGYKADIFEFISSEHTSKNLMIRAVYTGNKKDNEQEIEKIKNYYNIQGQQHLEKLLLA